MLAASASREALWRCSDDGVRDGGQRGCGDQISRYYPRGGDMPRDSCQQSGCAVARLPRLVEIDRNIINGNHGPMSSGAFCSRLRPADGKRAALVAQLAPAGRCTVGVDFHFFMQRDVVARR